MSTTLAILIENRIIPPGIVRTNISAISSRWPLRMSFVDPVVDLFLGATKNMATFFLKKNTVLRNKQPTRFHHFNSPIVRLSIVLQYRTMQLLWLPRESRHAMSGCSQQKLYDSGSWKQEAAWNCCFRCGLPSCRLRAAYSDCSCLMQMHTKCLSARSTRPI